MNATTETTEVEGSIKAELQAAAQAICDMVAAGKTIGPFHKRCDVIEIGAVKVAGPKSPQAGRAFIKLELCLADGGYMLKGGDFKGGEHVDAFTMIKEIRSRVYDAAKVLGLDVARSKVRARAFHNDPFNQTADYHADLFVYLPVGVRS